MPENVDKDRLKQWEANALPVESAERLKALSAPPSSPRRVQRKRTKGWRMPENTVSVCRPSKWGNPYKVGVPVQNQASLMSCIMSGAVGPREWQENAELDTEQAVTLYEYHLTQGGRYLPLAELRGKNLACFCPLGKPCHADVLLRWANEGQAWRA